jgi:ribosomal protein L6P/L9E
MGNSYLLTLSISRGWGILKLSQMQMRNSFQDCSVLRYSLLFNIFLGFHKNYYYYLKLKGMGFKTAGNSLGVNFKLGYSHKLILLRIRDICFFIMTKQLLRIVGKNSSFLDNLIASIVKLRKTTVYKKKGIFLKGSISKLKLTSKKSKF